MSAKHCTYSFALLMFFLSHYSFSQSTILGQDGSRVIQTAVPFLQLSPDARAAGVGETGVATTADANSAYWNSAKMVRLEDNLSLSYSYTPWLRKVVSDMGLHHVALAITDSKKYAPGVSLSYFGLGDILLTGPSGALLQLETPLEIAVNFSYAYALSEHFSLGANAKLIASSLFNTVTSPKTDRIDSIAIDLGALYKKETTVLGGDGFVNLGMTITNLGPKMEYLDDQLFLPDALKLGTAIGTRFGAKHRLSWSVDLSKLLVPTQQIYTRDERGRILLSDPNDPDSSPVITRCKDPNREWLSGTFGSFTDAPEGFSEEIQEIMLATGLEYWFMDIAALRAGYYRETVDKGDRQLHRRHRRSLPIN